MSRNAYDPTDTSDTPLFEPRQPPREPPPPTEPPPLSRAEQNVRRFERFHREHPRIWALFERFTFELIRAGRSTYSAYAIVHRIRWETDLAGHGDFAICNDFIPYYARMFEAVHERHSGFFVLRYRTTADRPPHDTEFTAADVRPANDDDDLRARLRRLSLEFPPD